MWRGWLTAALAGSACAWQASCEPAADARAMESPEAAHAPIAVTKPKPTPAPPAAAEVPPSPPPLTAGQMVRIPAGTLQLGSETGSPHRDPAREADALPVELGAFEIDRLPHPNDPGAKPTTGVTRAEAAALCEQAGKRLCQELEWERACKGPDGATFVTGGQLDVEQCQKDAAACASAEGVHRMGAALREWTASEAEGGIGNSLRTAVVRGAASDAPAGEHRCAARDGATPDSSASTLGFRCCRGAPATTERYPAQPDHPQTRPAELDAREQRTILASVPELSAYAEGFKPFTRADIDEALRRGKRSRNSVRYWSILPSSVHWSPVRGEQLLVLSGHVSQGALVAVLHSLGDGHYRHAASTVVAEDDATIALGASTEHRQQLIWSTCWDCMGEGGAIVWGDDAQVRFGFR
jgi:formylglycine-generating enzyme required for sulfatase activity